MEHLAARLAALVRRHATDPIAGPPLFHYTTAEGLIGIVGSGTLRASRARSLNDFYEYEYGLGLGRSFLRAKQQGAKRRSLEAAFLGGTLERLVALDPYIVSFSTEGDLLSQWRSYGASGGGFSVGFSRAALPLKVDEALSFELVRVRYGDEEVPRVFERAYAAFMNTLRARGARHGARSSAAAVALASGVFAAFFALIASRFKDAAFREECEWRLVTSPRAASDEGEQMLARYLAFEARRGLIVPYLLADYSARRPALPIESITIGPTADPDLSRDAIHKLLLKSGYEVGRVAVRTSRTPLRY